MRSRSPADGLQRLAGFHAIAARLRSAPETVRGLYIDSSRRDARARALVDQARGCGVEVHAVDGAAIESMLSDARHQGVVALVEPLARAETLDDILDATREPALVLVLDGVTDPRNLGACLRSADAFGAQAVVVPKDRASGVTPVVAKAASGTR